MNQQCKRKMISSDAGQHEKKAAATKCKSSLSYLPSLGSDWGLVTGN